MKAVETKRNGQIKIFLEVEMTGVALITNNGKLDCSELQPTGEKIDEMHQRANKIESNNSGFFG